jgi:hypothetical protein
MKLGEAAGRQQKMIEKAGAGSGTADDKYWWFHSRITENDYQQIPS